VTKKSKGEPFPKPRSVKPSSPVKVMGPIKLISKKEVLAKLDGISNSTLWDYIRQGRIPPAVQIGPEGGNRSKIAWIESEVDEAIVKLPRRVQGSKPTPSGS
jgi:predicted DNA-binding transcriptional regulator AlpA